jgi:hypothetical protein
MNVKPEVPLFANMNCSQPWHAAGTAAPLQAVLAKKFELSWSE